MQEKIRDAIAYLKTLDMERLADGKYVVDDDFYYMVQSYATRTPENCRLESHRAFVDIQWMIHGTDAIRCASINDLKEKIPYDVDKDVMFWEEKENMLEVVLNDGSYLVLYPEDAHEPGLAVGACTPVKKIVAKIRMK